MALPRVKGAKMGANSFRTKYRLFALCLMVLTSCTPALAAPTASPTLGPVEPPVATLEINGQTQTAGIGSYCWSGSQGRQTCADTAGVPTAHDPLVTDTPFVGHFHLPLTDPPESLYVTVMTVVPYNDLTGGAGETRLWQITSGWSGELPSKARWTMNSWIVRACMSSS